MSNEAINWAFRQDLKTTPKFVLVALADYADEHHSCFPARRKIAERVGASQATVKRAIGELEEKGYLVSNGRVGPNGNRTTNRYVLRVNTPPGQFEPGVQNDPGPGSICTHPRVTHDPAPGSIVTQQEPPIEPSLNPHLNQSAPNGDAAPEWVIAKRAYDATDGALKFMAIKGIAKWALEKKHEPLERVEQGIADLHHRGKPITKATMDQWFNGAFDRGPSWNQGNDQRMDDGLAMVMRARQQEQKGISA